VIPKVIIGVKGKILTLLTDGFIIEGGGDFYKVRHEFLVGKKVFQPGDCVKLTFELCEEAGECAASEGYAELG